MLRWLRIAFSVLCGSACLIFVALWVRSYSWWDAVYYHPAPSVMYDIIANEGRFEFANVSEYVGVLSHVPPIGWSRQTSSAAQRRAEAATHTGVDSEAGSFWARAFPGFSTAGVWVYVPIWSLVLITGGLASVPWIFRRYSLRTLLVVTTLVAIGLGAIVYAVR